jgi:hypothetical protein
MAQPPCHPALAVLRSQTDRSISASVARIRRNLPKSRDPSRDAIVWASETDNKIPIFTVSTH